MVDAAIGQLGPVLAGSSTRFTVSSRMHSTRDAVSPRIKGEGVMLKGGPGANTALFYPIKLVSSENTQ